MRVNRTCFSDFFKLFFLKKPKNTCAIYPTTAKYFFKSTTQVGRAIKSKIEDGTVSREDLFITSKLWNIFHDPKDVQSAFEESLNNLGLNYLGKNFLQKKTSHKLEWRASPENKSDIEKYLCKHVLRRLRILYTYRKFMLRKITCVFISDIF